VTARWVVDIAAERKLHVTWEPISLLIKNQTPLDSPYYAPVAWSLGLLRVMEAVREAEGDGAVQRFYFEATTRIHHHKETEWDPAEALVAVGVAPTYATAAASETWDAAIRTRMDEGLALVGNDVGTPIISWTTRGRTHGIFGPVITRVPKSKPDRLKLWDAVRTVTELDGFWELKRTRTQRPEFGKPLKR
jgi:hypothetical protein